MLIQYERDGFVSSNLSASFEVLFKQMETLISTKTVVGDPVNINDVIIVPLVEASFGVVAGGAGGDMSGDKKGDFNGGGMGAKIAPSAVIVVVNGTAQLINVKNQESVNKLIDMVPGILAKLDLGGIFKKKDKTKDDGDIIIEFEKTGETEV